MGYISINKRNKTYVIIIELSRDYYFQYIKKLKSHIDNIEINSIKHF